MAHTRTSEQRHTSSICHRCQWKRHCSLGLWHCPTSNDLQSPNDEEDDVMAAQAKVISMRNLNLKISPEFSRLVLSICFLVNLRFLLRWERICIQSDICIKKWIYLFRKKHIPQTVGHLRRWESPEGSNSEHTTPPPAQRAPPSVSYHSEWLTYPPVKCGIYPGLLAFFPTQTGHQILPILLPMYVRDLFTHLHPHS